MQQRLVLGRDPRRRHYRRDRLDALSLARQQQAPAIITQRLRPIGMPDHPGQRLDVGRKPEHLSVYQTSPKLWEREAFEEQLDGAPEATGEPGKFSAGELGRLTVRVFFSAGAGLLAWSHMPVETAQ